MSEQCEPFRHEYKYAVSDAQIAILRTRLKGLVAPDILAGPSCTYDIRSMYFDSFDNRCMWENESGTDPREKYRIRIYNHSTGFIRLECKRKERNKTLKSGCRLTLTQCLALMKGSFDIETNNMHPVLQRLVLLMRTEWMRPCILVEYTREAYVYPAGNVRITFDKYLASSNDTKLFLDEQIPRRPVMPIGQQLMEVKYDAFLPDMIYRTLQTDNLRATAYSKYYLCRKYSF